LCAHDQTEVFTNNPTARVPYKEINTEGVKYWLEDHPLETQAQWTGPDKWAAREVEAVWTFFHNKQVAGQPVFRWIKGSAKDMREPEGEEATTIDEYSIYGTWPTAVNCCALFSHLRSILRSIGACGSATERCRT
jgi:hypothetical protein